MHPTVDATVVDRLYLLLGTLLLDISMYDMV